MQRCACHHEACGASVPTRTTHPPTHPPTHRSPTQPPLSFPGEQHTHHSTVVVPSTSWREKRDQILTCHVVIPTSGAPPRPGAARRRRAARESRRASSSFRSTRGGGGGDVARLHGTPPRVSRVENDVSLSRNDSVVHTDPVSSSQQRGRHACVLHPAEGLACAARPRRA